MLIQKIYKNLSKIAIVFLFLSSLSFTSLINVVGADISIPVYVGPNGTDGQGGAICNFDNGNNFCKKGKTGESYKAYKDCSQSALPDSENNGIVTAGLPIAACSPSFKTYATEPSFTLIKTDADAITNGTGAGGTPATGSLTYSTKKYKVNLKGKTETVDLQCDFASKACGTQTATLKVTYAGCVEKPPDSAECTTKVSDTFIQTKSELATALTAANVDISGAASSGAARGSTSNALGSLFTILFNIVLAVLSLLAWFFGTALSYVMFLLGGALLVLIRVNPAAGEWIQVASAPWGVVQSIANLVILGTFIFVAFAYILNITKYKTKIDSFLTNIVIVAIVTNLTLLGCASIINIAQGVGDAFVGGYASIKKIKDPGDYNGIAQVFIGDTLTSFKKVSAIRCNNVKSSSAGTGVSGQTPATRTGATQTVAQATTAAECGDFEGASNLGNLFGDIFKKDTGTNASTLIRELVYIGIVGFGILAFWRIMMLALIRAVSLWLLMVTSPLALVAYFSPEGFGLKKQADKWAHNFFHFTVFYPAFVLGLILAQEMTRAFNTATTAAATTIKSANVASGTVSSDSTQIIILTLLGGLVAVGILKLLADFFEGALKEITEAAFNGAKTLAGGGAALLRGAGAVAPGITGALSNSLGRNIVKLDSKISDKKLLRDNMSMTDPNREKATKEIAALEKTKLRRQSRLKTYSAVNNVATGLRDRVVNPIANLTEMLPEYLEGATKLPDKIGAKWSRERKARIDSFKARDSLAKEYFIRKNSGLFNSLGIDADDDPNAKLRGEDQESLKDKDPDFRSKLLRDGVRNAYAKSMGLDQQIARGVYVKRAERILKAAGGNFDNISNSKDRDFITDGIKQFQGDGVIMSQMADNPMLRRAVGDAMNSKSLDSETLSKLRKTNPIFITDEEERKRQVRSLSEEERRDLGSFNWRDQAVIDGLIESGVSQDEINKKSGSNGHARVNQKELKAQFMSRGLSEESADNLVRFRTTQSNKGVSTQEEALARLAQERQEDPLISSEDTRKAYDEVMNKHFGDEAAINEIVNRESTSTDPEVIKNEARIKINELNRESREMREYSRANASRLAGMTSAAVIQEMLEANNSGRESNKAASDIHFKLLDESAKIGAKALTERDTSRAIHDLNAKTFDNASNNGFAALADTNLQAEIGIQAHIKDEIKNNVLNSEGSLASVNTAGLADTFKQHYEAISAASLIQVETIRNAAMEKAIKNAQDGLGSNPDAVEYLSDKFGNTDASGNFTADNAKIAKIRGSFSQQGVKEANKLQQKIERSARSRQGGATQQNLNDAANEEFERKSAESKANADRAAEGVKSNYSNLSHVNAKAIFTINGAPSQQSQSFGDDKYTNEDNYGPRIAEFGADFGQVGPVAPYGVETGPIGPAEPPESSSQQATQTTTQQTQSTSQLPQIDRITDAGRTFFRVQGESTLLSYDQMRQRMNTDYPGSNWS